MVQSSKRMSFFLFLKIKTLILNLNGTWREHKHKYTNDHKERVKFTVVIQNSTLCMRKVRILYIFTNINVIIAFIRIRIYCLLTFVCMYYYVHCTVYTYSFCLSLLCFSYTHTVCCAVL